VTFIVTSTRSKLELEHPNERQPSRIQTPTIALAYQTQITILQQQSKCFQEAFDDNTF
jgi:hypothetical protein